MNLKENTINKTINLGNIVEQLNRVTEIIQGASGGTVSDTQIKALNDEINLLKSNMLNLQKDINKYIDEDELKLKTDNIETSISNKVDTNTYTQALDNINSQISDINNKINNLSGGGTTASPKVLFEGKKVITSDEINSEQNGLDTRVRESYQNYLNGTDYNFLIFTFESKNYDKDKVYFSNFNDYELINETLIISKNGYGQSKKIMGFEGDSYIFIDDSVKEFYITYQMFNNNNPLCLKRIVAI